MTDLGAGHENLQPPPDSVYSSFCQNLMVWWEKNIALDVPGEACRDFYGRLFKPRSQDSHLPILAPTLRRVPALERTFLAYFRTASSFAVFGVVAAQLFRLEGSINSTLVSTFFHLGKPLGVVAEGIALLITVFGGLHCWQQQQLIAHKGRVRSAGWATWLVIGIILTVCVFPTSERRLVTPTD